MKRAIILFCLLLTIPVNAAESTIEIPATNEGLPGEGPIRRYDWFKSLWQRRRSAWAEQVQQDQGALVFLGDSITQGWGANLESAFGGVKVANRGISGDTTRGMLLRLDEDVLSLHPQGLVILMGTNDLEESAKPQQIAANLEKILREVQKHNKQLPVILCQIFPSSETKKRPASLIKETNELFQNVAREFPQVTVLDTWTLFADEQGNAKLEEFPDLLHPNHQGYVKWAAALRPLLATIGLLERDYQSQAELGYTSLFNGLDLDGWEYRPSTEQDKKSRANWRKNNPQAPPWPIVTGARQFDNQTATDDGRFQAINGRLVVTTPVEGRRIQQFYTQRDFPRDFVLKLEFRATPNADSGIFLRGRQLQCRDYALAGPYKDLKNYKPQGWNEIVIVVRGNSAFCTCNGEILERDFEIPVDGPIGVEGDRGQVEYRRIRFREISLDLPTSSPEEQGIPSSAILNFIDALEKIDSVHSFMLLRHGHVVAKGWWDPMKPGDPHQLYSLSKSFTSTAVGLAIEEKKLSLDDRVVSFFPDDVPEETSHNLSAMRVRDLLTMSTGHISADLRKFSFDSDAVWTKEFLALPVEHQPGTHFLYNTPATYMCSAIVQKVTGQSVLEYLQERLFAPLGIDGATWKECNQGICVGGFGLNIKTEDIARFGQLMLQKGEWHGRQIVPREWVEVATSKQTSNGSDPNNDWNQGYGFQFWRCRHGAYRGDGAFGQFCFVMPKQNAVVAITSGAANMGSIMQQVWNHLLPEMHDRPLRAKRETSKTLQQRLSNLQLPLVEGSAEAPERFAKRVAKLEIETNDLGIQSIQIDWKSEVPSITLTTTKSNIEFSVGKGKWHRSRVPNMSSFMEWLPNASDVGVAAQGAWARPDQLDIRIWLYESPYRLDVRFKFAEDSADVTVRQNLGLAKKNADLKGTLQ